MARNISFIIIHLFSEGARPPPHGYACPGTLINTNTLEAFSTADKNRIRDEEAAKVRRAAGST